MAAAFGHVAQPSFGAPMRLIRARIFGRRLKWPPNWPMGRVPDPPPRGLPRDAA